MEFEFLKDLLIAVIHLYHSVVVIHLVGVQVGVAFLIKMGDDVLD